jgi:hypothetical protein
VAVAIVLALSYALGAGFIAAADRLRLASQDDSNEFLAMLYEANRANASFYAVDPRGLAALDTPVDYLEINPPKGSDPAQIGRPGAIEDATRLRERLETLRTAASATDGLALLNSNDLNASLERVVDDLSDYYLLGYYSTNLRSDGTFRKITLRARRPGVEVRSRRGYLAATSAEVTARARASVLPDLSALARDAALASLDRIRTDRAVRFCGGFGWEPVPDAPLDLRPVLWLTGGNWMVRRRASRSGVQAARPPSR